ncbi:MAG: hypothetical protein K0R39_2317 [Symbiobacteriaceae bacterium]|jgi:hypothetical protein|nr:hypothetical protein [Symbiobacteriaceae bacterium]
MQQSRLVRWALFLTPLVLFSLLMNAGPVLKRPMGIDDRFMAFLEETEQATLAEDWPAAADAWRRTDRAMSLVIRRVQVMSERDVAQDIFEDLAQLQGAIQAQDRSGALTQIAVLKALFKQLGQ